MSEPLKTPEPYGTLIDNLMIKDREYFESHPGIKTFERKYVYGEMWPELLPCYAVEKVIVHYIAPGLRARTVITKESL